MVFDIASFLIGHTIESYDRIEKMKIERRLTKNNVQGLKTREHVIKAAMECRRRCIDFAFGGVRFSPRMTRPLMNLNEAVFKNLSNGILRCDPIRRDLLEYQH